MPRGRDNPVATTAIWYPDAIVGLVLFWGVNVEQVGDWPSAT
jgi:hypothetical protein